MGAVYRPNLARHGGVGEVRRILPLGQLMQRRDVAWLQRRGFRFDDIRKAMQIDDMED